MRLVIDVLIVLAVVYVVIDAVVSYRAAAGTVWQKLLAVGKESATVLWSRFTILVAGATDGLVWLADLAGQPAVAGAIQSYLKPSYVAGLMIAVAVITELARRRTLVRS